MRWQWEQCDSTEYRSQQHLPLHFLMSRSTWADHCFWRVIEEMKNSFKISWAKKNPKSLFFAVDLYTVQRKMCDGQKGFEGIEAVAASYLRLHPEVCACVSVAVWVCVCISGCVYGFVYVCLCFCVCVLSGHRTIIRPIWWCGQPPTTPAHI